jgi:hypothetical protein
MLLTNTRTRTKTFLALGIEANHQGRSALLGRLSDKDNGMACCVQSASVVRRRKRPVWEDVGRDPVYEATLRLWDCNDDGVPFGRRQSHKCMDGIELRHTNERGEDVACRVRFIYSRACFGLVRHLQCRGCDRPCDVLCICPSLDQLECPQCCWTPYRSQYRTRYDRAEIKLDRIRRKLGDLFLDGDEWPSKPSKMRWATYHELTTRATRYAAATYPQR